MVEHLESFKKLTRRLHELHRRGLADSIEAGAIRDAADPFWYAMEPEEQAEAAEYSERLYNETPAAGDL